ncbi:hypothetical protein [Modestobacter italicus]|uniref:hypothetical protein n=1 Tax=Modestobacter italicus (strain DSM 44449 / CECT 9708 / BC 501) TaxID=2732864 RepID=UPI001C987FCC|nr:hypothetical protein [Modestobacter italicus]
MDALIAVVVVAVLIAVCLALVPAARRSEGPTADVLRWVALALAVLGAALLARDVWADAGTFVVAALGLPVVVLLVPVLLARSRWAGLASTAAATVVLAWALVWGLGGGLVLLPAVVAEFVAAALTPRHRALTGS